MRACALVVALAACSDDAAGPEVVVADARLGGADPVVLGVSATTVFWTASPSATTTLVAAAAISALPAQATSIATAAGAVAHGGDHVVFVGDNGYLARVDAAGTVSRITPAAPDALGASAASPPVAAWTEGPLVTWGSEGPQLSATLNRIDTCDHVRVTDQHIYVAADGATGRRLLRIDQRTATVTPLTAAETWASMFPGGPAAGATYSGRIVDADATGALWLVEELPSRRGIVVHVPLDGAPSLLLQHVMGASGFFASTETLYWQERDALLAAPRGGGPASIVASLSGTAGAFADGHVYVTRDGSIERLRVE